jgi:hypothetical protein
MNRRGFLKGVLITTTAAASSTALVQLASPEDLRQLDVRRPIILGQPEPYLFEFGDGELYVRLKNGGFVAVGYITHFAMTRSVHEVTTWEGEGILIPGLKRGQVFFEGSSERI